MRDQLWTARNEMTSAAGDIGNLCSLMRVAAESPEPVEAGSLYALITALTSIEGRLNCAAEKIRTKVPKAA